MHMEKNVHEILLEILPSVKGKSKDRKNFMRIYKI